MTTFCTTLFNHPFLLLLLILCIKCNCASARRVGGAVLVGELREMLKEMSCPQNALISENLCPLLLFRVTGKVGR